MTVNAQEEMQVGNHWLLKRDYAQAWRWYTEAERELPKAVPSEGERWLELWQLGQPQSLNFFQYYCLTKLGRHEEAKGKLSEFRRVYPPLPSDQNPQGLAKPGEFSVALWRDLYMAEVFLSLDAAEDGEAFFRASMGEAKEDSARLSSAVVLGQILLQQKKPGAYVDLATNTVAPLLLNVRKAGPSAKDRDSTRFEEGQVVLSLLPLCSPKFLEGVPARQVEALATQWQALRSAATREEERVEIDLVLRAIYQRLGRDKERQEADQRIKSKRELLPDIDPDADLCRLFTAELAKLRLLAR
jgi:hypothetical protein